MAGTERTGAHSLRAGSSDATDAGAPTRDLNVHHGRPADVGHAGHGTDSPSADPHTAPDVEHRRKVRPAKTSAAATFALVFGLAALLSVLTVILSPLGLVLGVIGIVLGVVGMKMAGRVGVTGRGLALGGLVLSILAVLLAAVLAAGITTLLNDEGAVDWLEQRVEDVRGDLPAEVEVPQP